MVTKKIGIGIVGDPHWIDRNQHLCSAHIMFANNSQTTIANDKNLVLWNLYEADCDHLFLFEEDCVPIKAGWEQFFIDGAERNGIKHFCLCNKDYHEYAGYMGDTSLWRTGSGCMLYLHRSVIDKVGYINPKYGKYGYEHAAYSWRIFRAGFTPAWYTTLNGWEEWVCAWDLAQDTPLIEKRNVMTQEEKDASIAANWPIFVEEYNSKQLYYDFTA